MPRGRGTGPGSGRGGNDTTPARPAAVSGPGALARRTDGGPGQPIRPIPGGTYGDRQASIESQQAAPLARTAPPSSPAPPIAPSGPDVVPGGLGVPPTDVFAPTSRPGEPITTGALAMSPAGAAPDPDAELLASQLPLLEMRASMPGASEAFRIMVKRIRSALPIQPGDFTDG